MHPKPMLITEQLSENVRTVCTYSNTIRVPFLEALLVGVPTLSKRSVTILARNVPVFFFICLLEMHFILQETYFSGPVNCI